jgi:hypothetical protein
MEDTSAEAPAARIVTAQAARLLPHRPADVWRVVAAFGEIASWHPLIVSSTLEARSPRDDEVGAVRLLRTVDQAVIREELIELDDTGRRLSYRLLDSPFPVSEYLATIAITTPHGRPSGCQVNWTARFTPHDYGETERLRRTFSEDVFKTGLEALHWHLN